VPFTAEQLSYAGFHSIDFYLKNDPIDQFNTAHPLLDRLMAERTAWSGGLQYVKENLRTGNDSNFQSYFGDQQVTYNRKRTLNQAKFTWGSFHDGFGLNEDELTENGITVTSDTGEVPSGDEKVQLANLFQENMATLKLGFQEKFDLMIHRDGTQSSTDIAGLDFLVATDPSDDTVGGIDSSLVALWRNYESTSLASGTVGAVVQGMETAWRECIRRAKSPPNFILAGADFIDAYRDDADAAVNRQIIVGSSGGNKNATTLDASIGSGADTGLYFKGVPVVWDPVFDDLDTADSPAIHWAKRCYFLNTRFIKLRPIKGHWMVPRRPPSVYDRYTHYWGLTAKAALTTGKRNAHAVLAIS
jgi:hypothetical protein